MNIEELIKDLELQEVEFKKSLKLKDDIGRAISSFSNSDGGAILVGVKNSGEVVGVSIGKNTLEELANYIKRNTDPQIFPSLTIEEVDDKKIIVIKVKESDDKPVFFKKHGFKRVGRTDLELTSSEIRKLAKEEKKRLKWDEKICEDAKLGDINADDVKQFLITAKRERNLDIDPDTPVDEALTRLKLMIDDKLTNAAILLFGKNPQDFFLQSEVRCARFKGTKARKPFIDMKVFSGNIIDQVDKALNFILEHIPMAAWLVPGKAQREEKYQYPPDAVREAVVNAICHRDYRSTSNVQVRVFDDRVEVWNPGRLPEGWTVEKLKEKHESKPFNPLIARQFFNIKLIEEWGTGTNEMVEECVEWGIPEPEFEQTPTSLIVVFRKDILSPEYLEKLELNDRQLSAIEYVKKHGKITNKEHREQFGITRVTAYHDLSGLVDKNVLVMFGKGPEIYYTLKHLTISNENLTISNENLTISNETKKEKT